MTLVYVSVALLIGFSAGWASMVFAFSPEVQRLRADAARWQYVRDNAEIVGEVQEGVWFWQFEAPDVHRDSFDADVDAAIAAYEQRQEAWL